MLNHYKVIEWNEKAGNEKWDIDYELEYNMLLEELQETREAMQKDDVREIVDWLIDIIFVSIWSLHKLGLTGYDIGESFNEVCRSNDTKHPYYKDRSGKIKKNPDWDKPNWDHVLYDFLQDLENKK